MDTNDAWLAIREFHLKFDVPAPHKPTKLTPAQVTRGAAWIREEVEELEAAEELVDQVDALIDVAYFAIGRLVEMGVPMAGPFAIVHGANMAKLWDDGQPRRRPEDGKIIKPPTWVAPEPLLQAHLDELSKKLRRVVVESPFAGDIERNVTYARAAMHDCLKRGEAPIASHLLYTQPGILKDGVPAERELGIEAGLLWGSQGEATVVYTDLGMSSGMAFGIARAQAEGRPVEMRSLPDWSA